MRTLPRTSTRSFVGPSPLVGFTDFPETPLEGVFSWGPAPVDGSGMNGTVGGNPTTNAYAPAPGSGGGASPTSGTPDVASGGPVEVTGTPGQTMNLNIGNPNQTIKIGKGNYEFAVNNDIFFLETTGSLAGNWSADTPVECGIDTTTSAVPSPDPLYFSVTTGIQIPIVFPPPAFTTQPADATVTAPGTATFTAAASGSPTYQWSSEAPGASSFTAISGATSASYTTPATTTTQSGTKFEVTATNSGGSVTSNVATLTVNPGLTAPVITTQPTPQTVTAPGTATFTAAASGNPAPTYQWSSEAPGASSFTAISGATSASYTTPATTVAQSGTKFEVTATNSQGSATSNAATLTVNPPLVAPVITTQPADVTVTAPGTATFTAAASGNPAATYQWSSEAPGASSFTAISGATSASYTTPATTVAQSGTKFEVTATNSQGSATSNAATLTVDPPLVAPVITTQPADATVTAPGTATFTAAASGNPAATYQWSSEAPGASSFTAISGATSASYTTPATTVAQSGTKFEVTATNSQGSATSNAATLTVNPPLVAPVITTQPADVTVTAPGTATFTAAASGNPAATYQWSSEAPGASSFTAISGATSASYTTPATTVAQSGTKFEVTATNSQGSATSNAATLTVNPPLVAPTITTQPADATVQAPGTATFSVVATGNPAPTYQWSSEAPGASSFTAISGATSARIRRRRPRPRRAARSSRSL